MLIKIQSKITTDINLIVMLEFINKYIINYKLQNNLGYVYNIIFLLTWLYSIHVNYGIEIIENYEIIPISNV